MIERTKSKFYIDENTYIHSKPTSDILQKIWDEWNPEPIIEEIIPEPVYEPVNEIVVNDETIVEEIKVKRRLIQWKYQKI